MVWGKWIKELCLSPNTRTQGHIIKLIATIFSTNKIFSTNLWNLLPPDIVTANNEGGFKMILDHIMER